MPPGITAAQFIKKLKAHRSSLRWRRSSVYFKSGEGEYGEGDKFIGVRMGQVFELAKEFIEMPRSEIEKLLESDIHEARAGALSIMGKQGPQQKTSDGRRKELFNLYMRRYDPLITGTWVILGALYVVASTGLTSRAASCTNCALEKYLGAPHRDCRHWTIHQTGRRRRHFKIAAILLQDDNFIHKAIGAGCCRCRRSIQEATELFRQNAAPGRYAPCATR